MCSCVTFFNKIIEILREFAYIPAYKTQNDALTKFAQFPIYSL